MNILIPCMRHKLLHITFLNAIQVVTRQIFAMSERIIHYHLVRNRETHCKKIHQLDSHSSVFSDGEDTVCWKCVTEFSASSKRICMVLLHATDI